MGQVSVAQRRQRGHRPQDPDARAGATRKSRARRQSKDHRRPAGELSVHDHLDAGHVPAILEMTHNGEEQGDGLADVLFGDYNPAGRLTQTWVASMDQLPPMMDYDVRHGRTYLYLQAKPLYAFGFGLSYTKFTYSNLKVSSSAIKTGDELTVSVDVKNDGKRDGEEVVQMYVTHRGSTIARPLKELKAFERVPLRAGERKTIVLPLE